jgi:hypothetical protein
VLFRAGFEDSLGQEGMRMLLRYSNELTLVRPSDGRIVELQWAAVPRYFSIPIEADAAVERSRPTEFAGRSLPTLQQEDELLAYCYRNSLQLAVQHSIKTLAFPSISTGAYRFPLQRAARIAMETINHFMSTDSSFVEITIVCFDQQTYQTYIRLGRI